MVTVDSVPLLDFLLGVSDALDLASEALSSHQIRTAFIVRRMAAILRWRDEATEAVLMAALVHDIGALSTDEKVDLHQLHYGQDLDRHCIIGENLLATVGPLSLAARLVRGHHKGWEQTRKSFLDLLSNAIALADWVEVTIRRETFILSQSEDIRREILTKNGWRFAPELVEAFLEASATDAFWLDLVSPAVGAIFRSEAYLRYTEFGADDLGSLSVLIRSIIDFRSPFTATHSAGVSAAAATIAGALGFSEKEISSMRIAGNLHDVGKLAVPNAILNKQGPLTIAEGAIMRQHPYRTFGIVRSCGFPDWMAQWAGYHHEKLDGSGYPYSLAASGICAGSRIVQVADIFIALTEDRPYRRRMEVEDAEVEVRRLVDRGALDGSTAAALHEMRGEVMAVAEQERETARWLYRREIPETMDSPFP